MQVDLTEVIAQPFFMSLGFHTYGLPELLMCNLHINEDSRAVMITAIQQLHRNLIDPGARGLVTTRLLTSTTFSTLMLQTHYRSESGIVMPRVMRAGVRKLDANEARLLLAQLYEHGTASGLVTAEQVEGIGRLGVAVMEMADERNYLPGQRGYDIRRRSKINTVTAH